MENQGGFEHGRTYTYTHCFKTGRTRTGNVTVKEWPQGFLSNPFRSILPQALRFRSLSMFPLMDINMTNGW
jgi:hypothetical protein